MGLSLLEVAEALEEGALSYKYASTSPKDLPVGLLRAYGCDCAQRTLLRCEAMGLQVLPSMWEAIQAKKQWAQGLLSQEELDGAYQRANQELLGLGTEQVYPPVGRRERRWQELRLAWLCRVWATCGERSFWLMFEGMLPMDEPPEVALDAEAPPLQPPQGLAPEG